MSGIRKSRRTAARHPSGSAIIAGRPSTIAKAVPRTAIASMSGFVHMESDSANGGSREFGLANRRPNGSVRVADEDERGPVLRMGEGHRVLGLGRDNLQVDVFATGATGDAVADLRRQDSGFLAG
jgi:hypothetical protein